jgi:hypothetical protein
VDGDSDAYANSDAHDYANVHENTDTDEYGDGDSDEYANSDRDGYAGERVFEGGRGDLRGRASGFAGHVRVSVAR